jgi:hypothetical protein
MSISSNVRLGAACRTNSRWATRLPELIGAIKNTASRDLDDLAQEGVMQKVDERVEARTTCFRGEGTRRPASMSRKGPKP